MSIGVHPINLQTYTLEEDVTERFVLVCEGTAEGSARLPAAAGDLKKILGVIQTTGLSGQSVSVAKKGSSTYMVAGALAARGARLTSTVAAPKGRGTPLAEPTISNPPTQAEVQDVLAYDTTAVAVVETAAAADGDIIIVTLR